MCPNGSKKSCNKALDDYGALNFMGYIFGAPQKSLVKQKISMFLSCSFLSENQEIRHQALALTIFANVDYNEVNAGAQRVNANNAAPIVMRLIANQPIIESCSPSKTTPKTAISTIDSLSSGATWDT